MNLSIELIFSVFLGKGHAPAQAQTTQFRQTNSVIVETVTKSESSAKVQNLSNRMHQVHSDATKIVAKGPGLEKAFQNKQNTFSVKADAAGIIDNFSVMSQSCLICYL